MEQLPPEATDAPAQTTPSSDPSGEKPAVPDTPAPTLIGPEGLRAIATGIGYLLFWQVVRKIPSGSMVVVAITTLLSLLLVLLFNVRLARAIRSPRSIGINLAMSVVALMPLILPRLLGPLFPTWAGWPMIGPYLQKYGLLFHGVNGMYALALIWMASSIGVAISRLAREFKLLLPMGVALALVDLWAVLGGGLVEKAVNEKNSLARTAMSALTVQLPTTQATTGAAPLQLLIGTADFLFIALFFACFLRFGIPSRRTFQALFVTLFLYMSVVFVLGIPLPALVPIAAVVIGMNWRRFHYERSEAFALLYAGIILAAALGFLVFRSRHS